MIKKQLKKGFTKIRLRTYIALGLLLLLLPVVLFSLFKPQSSTATWMNDSWTYRVKVPVTAHTGAETNVYFTKTVDTSDTTKFQSDCGDIRFTDTNGKILPYYIASGCSTASTVIHVLVATFPAGATDYYMYYGNPAAPNGFSSADFTAGTGVTVGSVGTEEKGTVPVAYWTFDDNSGTTARDVTNYGTNGTLTNITSPGNGTSGWQTEDLCIIGRCLSFDGTDDYVTVSDANSLDLTTSFTISAWVYSRTDSASEIALVNKGRDATATYAYQLGLEGQRFTLKLYDGTTNPLLSGNTVSEKGNWYFVVGTYDGSTMKLYVNGKFDGSVATSINVGNQTGALVIGKNANASNRYFSGKMDDVRIYKYPLSEAQVKANYINRGNSDAVSTSLGYDNQRYLTDGLQGYWKMDESAANTCEGGVNDSCDSSGLGADGLWNGSAAKAAGKFGNSVTFDGASSITATGTMTTGAVTLTAWIYPTSTTGRVDIVNTSPYNFLNLQSAKLCFYDGQVNNAYFCSTASISTNTWTHVAGTYDPSTGIEKLFINGVLDSSFAPSGTPTNGSVETSIGYCGACASNYFTGRIDEVRLYQKTLSEHDIKSLYNWTPGPLGYWKFDEKTGTSAYDSSGNGNTATIADVTTIGSWTSGKYGGAYSWAGGEDGDSANFASQVNAGKSNSASFWFKCTESGNDAVILGQDTTDGYMTYIDNCDVGSTWYYRPGGGAGAVSVSHGGFTLGTWYHLEVTRDSTTVKFYKNGVQIGATQTLNIDGDTKFQSLNNYNAGATSYAGAIGLDDVRVYNYARSQGQVIEDMNGGHPLGGSPIGSQIAHYSLDEQQGQTINNTGSLGSTYNGTVGASTSVASDDPTWKTPTDCKNNGCLSFDGTNDYAQVTDLSAQMDNTPLTISGWVYPTSSGSNQHLIGIRNDGSADFYMVQLSGGTSVEARFRNSGGTSYTITATSSLTLNTWQHIALTYDGSTLSYYKNGKLVSTLAASGTITDTAANFGIGGDGDDGNNPFTGKIDDIKIYRGSLNSDQIGVDYNAGANINFGTTAALESSQLSDGTGNPPVGYWKLDEKTGTTASDISGNTNTGTLTNNPTWTQGKFGSAINFDGASGFINAQSGSTLDDLGPVSVSFWVYPRSAGEGSLGRFFEKNNTLMYIDGSTNISFEVTYSTTNLKRRATSLLTLNTWQYITMTWDGTTTATGIKIYKNGAEASTYGVTQNASGSRTSDAASNFYIGNRSGDDRTFDGVLDDFKVYNYARTQAQVAYDYNRGTPVGYWRLDECQGTSVNDSSGNGNTGTLTVGASGTQTSAGTCNTASSAWGNGTSGKFNNSLNFDGTDDYVACTDASCGGTTKLDFGVSAPFSFGAWINTSSAASKIIMSKKDGTTSGSAGYLLQLSASNFAVCRISDGTTQVSPTDTIALNDSLWHFVMCVQSGSSLSLYVDGKLRVTSSTASVTGTLDNASDFRIGTTGTPSSNYFSGQIDEARVYNYELSLSQIQKIYNGGGSVNFGPASGQP